MTYESFRASGYALMIEENDERKILFKRKTFAPVAFGSRVFSPAELKMSIYCKEFLGIYHDKNYATCTVKCLQLRPPI